LFGEEFAQVEQGLMDRCAGAALETTTNLAHESEEERTANGDGRHLEERDQDWVRTWVSRSRHHHQDDHERHETEREVAVHATVLEPTRALTPPPHLA